VGRGWPRRAGTLDQESAVRRTQYAPDSALAALGPEPNTAQIFSGHTECRGRRHRFPGGARTPQPIGAQGGSNSTRCHCLQRYAAAPPDMLFSPRLRSESLHHPKWWTFTGFLASAVETEAPARRPNLPAILRADRIRLCAPEFWKQSGHQLSFFRAPRPPRGAATEARVKTIEQLNSPEMVRTSSGHRGHRTSRDFNRRPYRDRHSIPMSHEQALRAKQPAWGCDSQRKSRGRALRRRN